MGAAQRRASVDIRRRRASVALFFNFSSAASGLEDISWDRFFAEFERATLAFVYRDTGPKGELDDLHEFVKRAAVPALTISGRSTITGQVI